MSKRNLPIGTRDEFGPLALKKSPTDQHLTTAFY